MFTDLVKFPSFKYDGKDIIIMSEKLGNYEADYTLKNPVCEYCDTDIPDTDFYLIIEGNPVCQGCEDLARAGKLKLP